MKDVADSLFYVGIPSITKYGIAIQAKNWEEASASRKEKIEKYSLSKTVSNVFIKIING